MGKGIIMYSFGDVVLAEVQYVDSSETKKRPALVLFEEYNNVVLAGITSNPEMKGISITKEEGMLQDSIIKLNYIFTMDSRSIVKTLFSVSAKKKQEIREAFVSKLK